MGAPVFCHPDEVADAESDAAIAPYLDLSQLPVAPVRWLYPTLLRRWDGGAVKIAGTVAEGDEVAGFRVIHFPGHAPGLIGLWRESDRVALVSDVVYLVDSARLKPLPEGEASVPHPAWAWDHAAGEGVGAQAGGAGPAGGRRRPRAAAARREPARDAGSGRPRSTEPAAAPQGHRAPGCHKLPLLMIGTYASAALICAASLLVGRALLSLAGRRSWSLAGAGGRLRRDARRDRAAGAGAGARDQRHPRRRRCCWSSPRRWSGGCPTRRRGRCGRGCRWRS